MNEDQLINLTKNGDDDAYNKLLFQFKNMIYKMILSYKMEMGDYRFDVEDIYQEACVALYNATKSYQATKGSKFSTYAYILMKSAIINCVAKNIRTYNEEYFSIDNFYYADSDSRLASSSVAENPITFYKRKEFSKDFHRFYDKLSKEDQRVIALRSEGKSYKEIAHELGISFKRVDNRLAQLKRQFKRYMKEHDITYPYN